MKAWDDRAKIDARDYFIKQSPRVAHQYWSMAAQCTEPGNEFEQVIASGLCRPDQFHGVDYDRDIKAANVAAHPEARWYRGDFHRVMSKAKSKGYFRPSIVNADLTCTADPDGAPYIAQIMSLLSDYDDVTLVANFVLGTRHRAHHDGQYVIDCLYRNFLFQQAMRSGWQCDGDHYIYQGTGDHDTRMATFIMRKPARLALAA